MTDYREMMRAPRTEVRMPIPLTEQVPEFDETAWQDAAQYAGPLSSGEKAGGVSLREALGMPQEIEDLWPGHFYRPPKLKQLETIIPLSERMTALFQQGEVIEAVNCAVEIVCLMAVDSEFRPVAPDDVKDAFDENEIALVIDHMLKREGLIVEDDRGNAPGGRLIGWRNFQSSAAAIPDTLSTEPETN